MSTNIFEISKLTDTGLYNHVLPPVLFTEGGRVAHMSNLSSYTKESMCDTPPKIQEELFMHHGAPGTPRDIGTPIRIF